MYQLAPDFRQGLGVTFGEAVLEHHGPAVKEEDGRHRPHSSPAATPRDKTAWRSRLLPSADGWRITGRSVGDTNIVPGTEPRSGLQESGQTPTDDGFCLVHGAIDQFLDRRNVVDEARHHAA
jgi:hypothetical protein